jgi:hypothetical protein
MLAGAVPNAPFPQRDGYRESAPSGGLCDTLAWKR